MINKGHIADVVARALDLEAVDDTATGERYRLRTTRHGDAMTVAAIPVRDGIFAEDDAVFFRVYVGREAR